MKFVWDENKNQSNIGKHGISFEEAQTVFFIVSFCERFGDTIRIITAWKANKKQREEYNANH